MLEDEILDAPANENPKPKERPIIITILCFFLLLTLFSRFPALYLQMYNFLEPWHLLLNSLITLGTAIGIGGLWFMRKWAVYILTVIIGYQLINFAFMGFWDFRYMLQPAVYLTILWSQFHKMK